MVFKDCVQQSSLGISQVNGEIAEKGTMTVFWVAFPYHAVRKSLVCWKLLCPLDGKKFGGG